MTSILLGERVTWHNGAMAGTVVAIFNVGVQVYLVVRVGDRLNMVGYDQVTFEVPTP